MSDRFEHHVMNVDESTMLEFLHDNAMGAHPTKACASRCMKDLMPVLLRWIDKEKERCTPTEDALLATTDLAITMIFTVAINVANDHKGAGELVDILKGKLDEQFGAARERLREGEAA